MRPALTHVALRVRDLPATVAFYRDYCAMTVIHERGEPGTEDHIVWLAEPGRESDLIFVILPGGEGAAGESSAMSHLGFAVESRDEVDRVAAKARSEGKLVWEPRQEHYPVGYFCGVGDPDGLIVEFSYGQPLGPGSEPLPKP